MAGDEKATGVILRIRPLSETSLIAHWLTPDLGRIATVAKGARRPKSPFRGKLDLNYLAEFSFVRSRRSDLHTLRELNVLKTNEPIRHDLTLLQQSAYFAGFIEQTTESETPLPEIFELFCQALAFLPNQTMPALTTFAFEVKGLNILGLQPDFDEGKLSEGAKKILQHCIASDWPALSNLKLSSPQVAEIGQFLHDFIVFHTGRIPKGRAAALGTP